MVRRIVTFTAGIVLVLSLAAWCVSLFRLEWNPRTHNVGIGLSRGLLLIHAPRTDEEPACCRFRGLGGPPLWWPPRSTVWYAVRLPGIPVHWMVRLPLWMPAESAGAVLAGARSFGRRSRIRAHRGLCPACAYDLTGITGPCPECGRTREQEP